MKSLLVIFAVLLLIIATPYVFEAIDDGLSQTYSYSASGVATGAGVYSANVTLPQALYNSSVVYVNSISSNTSSDAPSAASYNSVSKVLTVSGLDEALTHTLTISYQISSTIMNAGQLAFWTLMRWFWIFVIVGATVGAIYAFFTT